MTVKTEIRVYAVIVLCALIGLVWGSGKSAAIREERARREGAFATERATWEGALAVERAARQEAIESLRIRVSQVENRNADLLAWIGTTRELVIKAGIKPPPLPDSVEGGHDDP